MQRSVASSVRFIASPGGRKLPVRPFGRRSPGQARRSHPSTVIPTGAFRLIGLPHSLSLDRAQGEPISVSGVIVVPDGPVPPRGRCIIAWAHPMTGVAPRCAPSLLPNVFGTIPGLSEMLAGGYVVVQIILASAPPGHTPTSQE